MELTLNLERLPERAHDETPAWRAKFELDGEALRHSLAIKDDSELLAQLANYGVTLSRETLGQWTAVAGSSEKIARALKIQGQLKPGLTATDHAWVWTGITILWERWFPDSPNFEMLSALIGSGIEAQGANRCKDWLNAWRLVIRLADKLKLDTLRAFDTRFHGTELLQN